LPFRAMALSGFNSKMEVDPPRNLSSAFALFRAQILQKNDEKGSAGNQAILAAATHLQLSGGHAGILRRLRRIRLELAGTAAVPRRA
jgi:hypothetical protein